VQLISVQSFTYHKHSGNHLTDCEDFNSSNSLDESVDVSQEFSSDTWTVTTTTMH